jgi:glycosyltransferase involved in cell wall biosynthesis
VSRGNREEIRRSFGRVAERELEVVPNAAPATPPAAPVFRDEALERQLSGKVVVAYIGVFRVRKRVHALLLAMQEVARACPDAALLLVGGGRGYEDELRALARDLRIDRQVIFVGGVPAERVRYYLSLADIVCLLSSYEGMPIALLEAMAEAKAVVASNAYGMRDLLEGSGAGELVPVDDVDAAAVTLEALVRSPERRESLGRSARSLVRDRFQWQTVAKQYLGLAGMR